MLPLAPYGNRLPQLSFEVIRPVSRLAAGLRAVQLIPGAGEFVYAPAPVYADPYADDEGWDYAPPPPPPVYPRHGYYAYGGYDREPTVSVDYYGRRTRLLPEGK